MKSAVLINLAGRDDEVAERISVFHAV